MKHFSESTAILVILTGDELAMGKGSRTADAGALTPLTRSKIWDKWNDGANRDSAADTGADFEALTDAMGETAADVGPEYGIAAGLERMTADNGAPDILVVKYAAEGMAADPRSSVNLHPRGTGNAYATLTNGYLAPAIAKAKADYQHVIVGGLYLSLGKQDALPLSAGGQESAAEAFLGAVPEIVAGISDEAGAGVPIPTFGIVPPLLDRGKYTGLDVIRYAWEELRRKGAVFFHIDADREARYGLDGGAFEPGLLSGRGAVNVGAKLPKSYEFQGGRIK